MPVMLSRAEAIVKQISLENNNLSESQLMKADASLHTSGSPSSSLIENLLDF